MAAEWDYSETHDSMNYSSQNKPIVTGKHPPSSDANETDLGAQSSYMSPIIVPSVAHGSKPSISLFSTSKESEKPSSSEVLVDLGNGDSEKQMNSSVDGHLSTVVPFRQKEEEPGKIHVRQMSQGLPTQVADEKDSHIRLEWDRDHSPERYIHDLD